MHAKDLAPVALFVYNRPQHTKQAIESLQKNNLSTETILYVFADGPKPNSSVDEQQNIFETRALIKKINGFKQVIVVEKENNEGLAKSIISGVTDIVNKHGKIIVLEDDLVLSPFFLDFMNEGLEVFESSSNIYSINGFMFPINYPIKTITLLPYTSTWGWATWKSKWEVFNNSMDEKETLKTNSFLASRFNLGNYSYTNMLNYEHNAWGIKWYYSVFIRGGLNVFPTHSLVKNIGFDGSGTNGGKLSEPYREMDNSKITMSKIEKINLGFFDKFINHFEKENISLLRRLTNVFKKH